MRETPRILFLYTCHESERPLSRNMESALSQCIRTIPQDGFNLVVDAVHGTPAQITVRLMHPVHNWFAGVFAGLPTQTAVSINLSMVGNDTANPADVMKWVGFRPLMTYSDPVQYASYETFQRDAHGNWYSTDPLKTPHERYAGSGLVPEQESIPVAIAEQFLADHGHSWSPWREIEEAEADPQRNHFQLRHHFLFPTATIAMHYPYTHPYLQAFIQRLTRRSLPSVFIDHVGYTPEGRALQVIRVEATTDTPHDAHHRTILVTAQEHATEHVSSWVLHGMLMALLEQTPEAIAMRRTNTWLFVAIQDPDSNAHCLFDRTTNRFRSNLPANDCMEAMQYMHYFSNYVERGKTIDVALALHNVEANETPHLFCPYQDSRFFERVIALNRSLFTECISAGFITESPQDTWYRGQVNTRLFGWCADQFGSTDLPYEVNDRYPTSPLSLYRVQCLGRVMARHLSLEIDR